MGVSREQGTLGAAIGPPAAMLYAVLPEGVAMISPSACMPRAFSNCLPLMQIQMRSLHSWRLQTCTLVMWWPSM